MNDRKFYISLFIIVFSLCALGLTQASASSIKERMKGRIPAINSLKTKGFIGENNGGYLQYLGPEKPQEALVKEENRDRKKVYTAIAKKQNVTPVLVGQRRAKKLVELAKPGHQYQNAEGKWLKKQ